MIPGFGGEQKPENEAEGWSDPYLLGPRSSNTLLPTIPPLNSNSFEQLKNATNTFQSILLTINRSLSFTLLDYSSRFSFNSQTNAEFIKQVTALAHLDQEESRKLTNH
jgi:hypothetical protein